MYSFIKVCLHLIFSGCDNVEMVELSTATNLLYNQEVVVHQSKFSLTSFFTLYKVIPPTGGPVLLTPLSTDVGGHKKPKQ